MKQKFLLPLMFAAMSVTSHASIINRQSVVDIPEQELPKKFKNQAPGLQAARSGNVPPPVVATPVVPTWVTSVADNNFRMLINKWAASAKWHAIWEVEIDIPIDADDSVTGDFKTAVRHLLATTNLRSGDALKPCFHTNMVVRIVRETTKCNPNE